MKRVAKIADAEVLTWLCENLVVPLPMGILESLAWEAFKDRGVLRHGFGGKIRRLVPAHCSAFPHRFKGRDLFTFEGRIPKERHQRCRGLWALRPDAAAVLAKAA